MSVNVRLPDGGWRTLADNDHGESESLHRTVLSALSNQKQVRVFRTMSGTEVPSSAIIEVQGPAPRAR